MKAEDIKSAGMAVWDGKNNPLVSGKGQGSSRGGPLDPRGGRDSGAGKNIETGKGKSSKIDPRADMSPSEKSRVDAIIKETDRRIFGDKGEKQSSTKDSRGGSKGEAESKTDSTKGPRGEKSDMPGESKQGPRGEPRSEPGITKTSKVPQGSEPSGSKDRGPEAKPTVPDSKTPHGQEGDLPPSVPMPGIKFGGPDFGIKWPGSKGEKGEKSGPGKSPSDKGSRIEPARVQGARDAIVKILPEGRENVKIVRNLSPKESAGRKIEVKEPASVRSGDMRVTSVKIGSGRESQHGRVDIPVVVPVDFNVITSWVDLKGILKTGKSLISADTVRTDGPGTQPSESAKTGAKSVPAEQTGKKVADTTGAIKDPGDAFGGKLPEIKMTYAEQDGVSRSFQGGKIGAQVDKVGAAEGKAATTESKSGSPESKVAQLPVSTTGFIPPKGGIVSPDAAQTRPARETGTQTTANDQDQARVQGKAESDVQKAKPDRARPAAEAREGKLLLHELVRTNTFRLVVSRVSDRGLDGARVVAGDLSLWIAGTSDESSARTIREILGKFNLASPRRDFTPEITESGSYRVARSNSSQQLAAFASSARMAAIGAQLFGSSQEVPALEDSDESQESPGAESLLKQDESSSRADEGARQWHIVQDGETPESIAVVHFGDAALGALIREINKPLMQQMYDVYQQEHVDVLPVGVMILLPNEKDIEEYRHGSWS
ncbi:MAG: hypothetical protein AB7W16_21530 [Candidatus Obscuribacterales bacterium]